MIHHRARDFRRNRRLRLTPADGAEVSGYLAGKPAVVKAG